MDFSSKYNQKSLKTVTQVCENKFFISQIIDLIEQVSKLSKTPVYKMLVILVSSSLKSFR